MSAAAATLTGPQAVVGRRRPVQGRRSAGGAPASIAGGIDVGETISERLRFDSLVQRVVEFPGDS
jgi:hypothetical protein